jgi:hypothetical protein
MTLFQSVMESVLRLRQLRIWEEVCKKYHVHPARASQVARWIQEGTFYQHVQKD